MPMRVVGGGDPDDVRGVDRHFGKFVGELGRGVVFEQRVEASERVVLRVAAGLVDLVHDDHRVGVVAVDERVEDLAGLGVLPLRRGARQDPAGGQRAHADELVAGTEQLGQAAREVRLADAGIAEQQHRLELERIVR